MSIKNISKAKQKLLPKSHSGHRHDDCISIKIETVTENR